MRHHVVLRMSLGVAARAAAVALAAVAVAACAAAGTRGAEDPPASDPSHAQPSHELPSHAHPDSAFAGVQERGEAAMGVNQYTSTHRFDALPDGGRIELQRDVDDPEGVAEIRRHLRHIVERFRAGDFALPAFVHDRPVPGTEVMAAKRDAIAYTFRELPRGGEVRLTTRDPEALRAIHAFMAFQRTDHRAGGEEGHGGH